MKRTTKSLLAMATGVCTALTLATGPSAPALAAPGTHPSGPKTAAQVLHWGQPLPSSDEFNYVGEPDTTKWFSYGVGSPQEDGKHCWPGHAGNGRRCVENNYVNGEYLRQTGEENGDTAGLGSVFNQRYGRYEVRARLQAAKGSVGNPYHAVLLLWPSNDDWPAGAEYDFLEVNVGDTCATAFLHYPNHEPKRQEEATHCPIDLTKWHAYAFEWSPTGLTGWIDGKLWYHFDQDGIQNAPYPMRLTIQLDNFFGTDMQKAYLDVDWARQYAYPQN